MLLKSKDASFTKSPSSKANSEAKRSASRVYPPIPIEELGWDVDFETYGFRRLCCNAMTQTPRVYNCSRNGVRFKQADISRALKGAHRAGFSLSRIEIDLDGRIVMVLNVTANEAPDELDVWISENARST